MVRMTLSAQYSPLDFMTPIPPGSYGPTLYLFFQYLEDPAGSFQSFSLLQADYLLVIEKIGVVSMIPSNCVE